jgi:hypothetical protein
LIKNFFNTIRTVRFFPSFKALGLPTFLEGVVFLEWVVFLEEEVFLAVSDML